MWLWLGGSQSKMLDEQTWSVSVKHKNAQIFKFLYDRAKIWQCNPLLRVSFCHGYHPICIRLVPDAFVQSGELPRVRRLGWPKGCSKWLGDAPFQSLRTTKDPVLGSSCCNVLSITGPCKLQSTQCSILSFPGSPEQGVSMEEILASSTLTLFFVSSLLSFTRSLNSEQAAFIYMPLCLQCKRTF